MLTIPFHRRTAVQKLDCLNWPDKFPYKPDVSFTAWHCGDALTLEYKVKEQSVRALEAVPGNFVYKDSCVEFFFQPRSEDPHYYNFEWNPVGTLYLAYRTGRDDAELAPADVLQMVKAEPSLGTEPFAERPSEGEWSLLVKIPAPALWRSGLESFGCLRARANFYKCGDGLAVPHYVSWAPIDTPRPDFHRPEFFAPLEFESEAGALKP